jgi:predicted ATPase
VASVVGIAFQTGLVGELLGAPVDPAALARLAESTLEVGAGTDTWRFGHPLIRDVAYAGLLASRRRELHGRLADRLEGLPGAAIGRIAQHRAAAGDSERAVPLLDVAALEAMSLGASAEAAGFWRSAAELLAAGPEADRFRALAAAALVGGAAAARPEA